MAPYTMEKAMPTENLWRVQMIMPGLAKRMKVFR
jgi:hypothetical protein